MKTRYYFGTLGELSEGRFIVRDIGSRSIGATLFKNEPLVLLNFCPHAGAPICSGKIVPKLLCGARQELQLDSANSVLRCPWHGWEFNLEDGHTSGFDSRLRLARLPFELDGESLFVWI